MWRKWCVLLWPKSVLMWEWSMFQCPATIWLTTRSITLFPLLGELAEPFVLLAKSLKSKSCQKESSSLLEVQLQEERFLPVRLLESKRNSSRAMFMEKSLLKTRKRTRWLFLSRMRILLRKSRKMAPKHGKRFVRFLTWFQYVMLITERPLELQNIDTESWYLYWLSPLQTCG